MALMNFGNRGSDDSGGDYSERTDSPVISGGMAKGLSYVIPWAQQENMMLREEQLDRQAHKDIQAKAKLLGEDIKLPKTDDSYVGQKLKEYAGGQLHKLGQFVTENPDFQSDPGKWIQYKSLADSVANNDYAVRCAKVKDEYADLTKYMKDNPNDLSDPHSGLRDELQKYSNWKKTGSFDGNEKNQQDYMFSKPMSFNFDKDMKAIGSGTRGINNPWTSEDGKLYGTNTIADKDEIQALATGYLKDPFTLQHVKDLYDSDALTKDQRLQYTNYQGMVASAIEAYMPKKGVEVKGQEKSINIHNYMGGGGGSEKNVNLFKPYLDGVNNDTQPASYKNIVLTNHMGKGTASDPHILKPPVGGDNPIMYTAIKDKTGSAALGPDITNQIDGKRWSVIVASNSTGEIIKDAKGNKYVRLTVFAQKKMTDEMTKELYAYAMTVQATDPTHAAELIGYKKQQLLGHIGEMDVFVPTKPDYEVDEKEYDDLAGADEGNAPKLENQYMQSERYKQSQQQPAQQNTTTTTTNKAPRPH